MKKEKMIINQRKSIRNYVHEEWIRGNRRGGVMPPKKGMGCRYDRGKEKRKVAKAVLELNGMRDLC